MTVLEFGTRTRVDKLAEKGIRNDNMHEKPAS